MSVQEEPGQGASASTEETFGLVELDDFTDCVFCVQSGISPKFRDGQRLELLIRDLQSGLVNPLTCDDMILRVAKEDARNAPPRYYTFDHRRLYCFWKAKVPRIRVRIVMSGWLFSAFARKCDRLGNRIDKLYVCW
jgi:hypothetical protein